MDGLLGLWGLAPTIEYRMSVHLRMVQSTKRKSDCQDHFQGITKLVPSGDSGTFPLLNWCLLVYHDQITTLKVFWACLGESWRDWQGVYGDIQYRVE